MSPHLPIRASKNRHHGDAVNEAIRRRGRAKDEELRQLSKGYWESPLSEFNQIQPEPLILSAESLWILRRAAEEKQISLRPAT